MNRSCDEHEQFRGFDAACGNYMKRLLLSLLAGLIALPLVAAVAFVVVIVLAGPHAGLLPEPIEAVVLVAGWLSLLVVPAFVAHRVWRRLGRTPDD